MATVPVFLLVLSGTTYGFITVPDLPSRAECEALAQRLNSIPVSRGGTVWARPFDCIPYEKAQERRDGR